MFAHNSIAELSIGFIKINIWGLFLSLGFASAVFFAVARARKSGIESGHILNIAIISIAGGLAGSRILYVLENFSHFSKSPLEIFNLSAGGLSFFGGFILSIAAVLLYVKKSSLKSRAAEVFDFLVMPFLLGNAIGRIGCFLARDHLGKAMKRPYFWGINLGGQLCHDPALYLILTDIALFLIFLKMYDKIKKIKGLAVLILLTEVGLSRLIWDSFRIEARYMGLAAGQWMGIAILIYAAASSVNIYYIHYLLNDYYAQARR